MVTKIKMNCQGTVDYTKFAAKDKFQTFHFSDGSATATLKVSEIWQNTSKSALSVQKRQELEQLHLLQFIFQIFSSIYYIEDLLYWWYHFGRRWNVS